MAARDTGQGGGAEQASQAPEPASTERSVSDLSPELQERLDEVLEGPPTDEEGGGDHQLEDWPVPKPEDIKVADPYQSYHRLPGDEAAQDERPRS